MKEIVDELRELSNSINTMLDLYSMYSETSAKITDVSKLLSEQQNKLFSKSWTTEQAMAKLGISEPTLIKRRKMGLIPYMKLGNRYYYFRPVKTKRGNGGING
jgi:hypothetical protein